jgi:hypothetical protein
MVEPPGHALLHCQPSCIPDWIDRDRPGHGRHCHRQSNFVLRRTPEHVLVEIGTWIALVMAPNRVGRRYQSRPAWDSDDKKNIIYSKSPSLTMRGTNRLSIGDGQLEATERSPYRLLQILTFLIGEQMFASSCPRHCILQS